MASLNFVKISLRGLVGRTSLLEQNALLSTSSIHCGSLKQPPVQVHGVEGRYATALYSAASKQKQLDKVEADLLSFQALLKKEPRFGEYLSNPILKKQEKKKEILNICKKLGATDVTTNTLGVMADNGRLRATSAVIESFEKIMSAHRGEVVCNVTSAKPLDDATKKDLESALQGFLKKGQHLILNTKVDDSVIGGLVVEIGDKYIDMSIASKIRTYENIIREAAYL